MCHTSVDANVPVFTGLPKHHQDVGLCETESAALAHSISGHLIISLIAILK